MPFELNITPVDGAVLLVYLLAVLGLGQALGRGQRTGSDYFLGGRNLPWGALLLSIVATETSTVTFLSLPALAAVTGGDFTFLQLTFGYILGRLLVVRWLLPRYFQGAPFTAYEMLEARFGPHTRRIAALLFLLTRNLGDGLRLFLTALVLQLITGMSLALAIATLGSVTMAYTLVGGARSVIWNDCLQFFIYTFGAVAALWVLTGLIPGGWGSLADFAAAGSKWRMLDFRLSLTQPGMTFWAGLIGGIFLTMASHGTDQMMVQRYLSARSLRDAGRALSLSGLLVAGQFALFLLIGVALAAYYTLVQGEAARLGAVDDRLFAGFIVQSMPVGLTGLTLAAVFAAAMSTLSSSLNSSANALVNDLWLPLTGQRPESGHAATGLRAGRIATGLSGLAQVLIALGATSLGSGESTVTGVLKVASFAAGPVLGLYLLAIFAPSVRERAALTGLALGIIGLAVLALASPLWWPWYAAAGAMLTSAAGLLAQGLLPKVGDSATAR